MTFHYFLADNLQVLKDVEAELEKGIASELQEADFKESKSTRGRKIKKSRKVIEAEEGIEGEDEEAEVQKTKKTKKTKTVCVKSVQEDNSKEQINAKLRAKHAVCSSFFSDSGSDVVQEVAPPYVVQDETDIDILTIMHLKALQKQWRWPMT